MRKGNHPIKVIQSPTTPVKYIQNYPKTNNSAIDLIPEYYDQKELEPSPSLNYNKYINNNYYKVQTYQKNSNESDDDSPNNINYFLNKNNSGPLRNKRIITSNKNYPANYSYYESKYSKKTTNSQKYNFNNNTYSVVRNNNNYKMKSYSNEKIKIYNNSISNSLIENLNRSHILFLKSSSNKNYNDYNTISPISPNKKPTEIFYSTDLKNQVNYQQKIENNNMKKKTNIIIYKEPFNSSINLTQKTKQIESPSIYSHDKLYNQNNNYSISNDSMKKKEDNLTDKNIHSLHSKSLKTASFSNTINNFHNNNYLKDRNNLNIINNKNNNLKQNNFKKVIKYINRSNDNINTNNKDNNVHPFKLKEDETSVINNNINNTTFNITYINENKNYIKKVYSNVILKPQSRDKFSLDNENQKEKIVVKDDRLLSNDVSRTPEQGIKIIRAKPIKVYTPLPDKFKKNNNQSELIKKVSFFNEKQENNQLKRNENNYMNEIKNIIYNSKPINQTNSRNSKDKKSSLYKEKNVQNNNHTLINDINLNQQSKNEGSESNLSINIKKIKEKSNNRDYKLIYNAKITQTKYRKKSDTLSAILIQNKINNKNTNTNTLTINANKSNISKTASKITKFTGPKINKSSLEVLNKKNNQNIESSKITQKKNNNEKRQINTPSNLSKLTIINTSSSNKTNEKNIRNKKEEILENKINKVNPFRLEEKEKEKNYRKKTLDVSKNNIKKEKEKIEKIVYIKKIEGTTLAGKNEKGITKTNQDTFFIEKNVNGVDNFNIFGVLDGHGDNGHLASKFVHNYIITQIKNHPLIKNERDPKKIYSKIIADGYQFLAKIYLDADVQITHQGFDCSRSGTTCIIIIQLLEHIICANTGDSRAMIVYDEDDNLFKSQVYPLSYDCKPELPNEKERILESGGVVEKAYYSDDEDGEYSGPFRVWVKGEDFPGLAMSRSIGDMDAKKVGVIPNPQIVEYNIDKLSKYFVIASDGIWEFISNEDCMEISNQYFLRNDCLGLCRELTRRASELWQTNDIIRDDITIVVGFF